MSALTQLLSLITLQPKINRYDSIIVGYIHSVDIVKNCVDRYNIFTIFR